MRLIGIFNYTATPGRIVEWRVSAATRATAAQAPTHDVPPSYNQEVHINTTLALKAAGIAAPSWLCSTFDIEGPVDLDALGVTFQRWIERHETLRSGFRLVDGELRRFTLHTEDISLDRADLGDFATGEDVVRHLKQRFDTATDPLNWPPYVLGVIVGEMRSTVYIAFDHTNIDGYSLAMVPHEIHELYRATLEDRGAELPAAGSYVEF